MPYAVYISNQQYTVDATTLVIDSKIGKRSTASFTIHTTNTQTHFQQYQPVKIYDQNGALAFRGFLDQPIKETKPGWQKSLEHQLTCCDLHWLADKRVVAASFTNKTVGYIVQWLIDNILASEGVTRGDIFDGLTPSTHLYPSLTIYPGGNIGLIPLQVFSYHTVSQALDTMASQAASSGIPYFWMINPDLSLDFVPYTAKVNPNKIDGTTIDDGTLSGTAPYVQRSNPNYRNTQYETGGMDLTSTQDEAFAGDGHKRSFTVGYDLSSKAPTVKVNGVTQTVAVKAINSGAQWYWAQGDKTITQDTSGTVLGTSDTLEIIYVGQFRSDFIIHDNSQISYQAALDGTSGIVESVDHDTSITNNAMALAKGGALLTTYAVQGTQFVGNTLVSGYAPGQLVTVDLPDHDIFDLPMLLEEVAASDQQDGYNIWYTLTGVSGPYDITWTDYYSKKLITAAPADTINTGTTDDTTFFAGFTASLSMTATLNVTFQSAFIPSHTKFPNTTSAAYPG